MGVFVSVVRVGLVYLSIHKLQLSRKVCSGFHGPRNADQVNGAADEEHYFVISRQHDPWCVLVLM